MANQDGVLKKKQLCHSEGDPAFGGDDRRISSSDMEILPPPKAGSE